MKRGCSLEVILEEIVDEACPPLLSLDSHLTRSPKLNLRRTRSLEILADLSCRDLCKEWDNDEFQVYKTRPIKLLEDYQESETSSGVGLGNIQDSDDSFSTSSHLNDVHQDSDDSSLSTKDHQYESLPYNSLTNDPCTLSVTELTRRLERTLESCKGLSGRRGPSYLGSDCRTPSPDSESSVLSRCSDYLQEYTPRDILENKRVVIVESENRPKMSNREENLPLWIQKGIMVNPQSWQTNDLSTVVKKILSIDNKGGHDNLSHTKSTVSVLTNSHLLRQRQLLKKDGKAYPSNLELYEEELPKPDTVRSVRSTFENMARTAKRTEATIFQDRIVKIKSNPTSRIFKYDSMGEKPSFHLPSLGAIPNPLRNKQLKCVMDNKGGHQKSVPAIVSPSVAKVSPTVNKSPISRPLSDRQTLDSDSAWSDGSDQYYDNDASSESSDISEFPDLSAFREVPQEVLQRIRSCGTSTTYFGGKIIAYQERNKRLIAQDIMDEILKRKMSVKMSPNGVSPKLVEIPKPKIISCTPKHSPERPVQERQPVTKTVSSPVSTGDKPKEPEEKRPTPLPRKLVKTQSHNIPETSVIKDYNLYSVRPKPKQDMEFEEFEFSENPVRGDGSPELSPIVLSPTQVTDSYMDGQSLIFDFRNKNVEPHISLTCPP